MTIHGVQPTPEGHKLLIADYHGGTLAFTVLDKAGKATHRFYVTELSMVEQILYHVQNVHDSLQQEKYLKENPFAPLPNQEES